MKIVISNADTGEIFCEWDEVTATEIAAYSGSDVIVISDDEYIVGSVVLEHDNRILNIMVSLVGHEPEELIED